MKSNISPIEQSIRTNIAVLLPCYNEETTVAKVVTDFQRALPGARIYVYDNNSNDKTVAEARTANAIVRTEPLQGKGNVVRRMFADVEADVYILADGDDTYDANVAGVLVDKLLTESLDMINVARQADNQAAYRTGHIIGNRMLTKIVSLVFDSRVSDLLSGYRILSRRFVKSFPALSSGFEIETELSVHALQLRMPISEAISTYRERPIGSASKLSTFRDGIRILYTIVNLFQGERPFLFFGIISSLLAFIGLLAGLPVVVDYLETGLVLRFPTAILATGLMILSALSLVCGTILDTVTRGRHEQKRMRYLSIPAPNIPMARDYRFTPPIPSQSLSLEKAASAR